MARPTRSAALRDSMPANDADTIVAQTYNIDGGNWMS
jgi:hypothetical protein